jgi:hypothetical protein
VLIGEAKSTRLYAAVASRVSQTSGSPKGSMEAALSCNLKRFGGDIDAVDA